MINTKKSLIISTILTLLLCSILVSNASAADDNYTRTPTEETPGTSDNPMATATQEPNLIATQDGTTTDDSAQLYQQRDNSTAQQTDVDGAKYGDMLISTQTTPDYTGYFVVAGVLVVVIILSLIFIFVKKRK
jgi:hypothetical protein